MLTTESTAVPSSQGLIKKWLAERNELLVLYCQMSGKRRGKVLPDKQQINQFCDILIDYVSAGHFEVYEEIASRCSVNGSHNLELLESLLPQIHQTTDVVVHFNDKYTDFDDKMMNELDADLSILGEAIAYRVELEDKLIHQIRSKEA